MRCAQVNANGNLGGLRCFIFDKLVNMLKILFLLWTFDGNGNVIRLDWLHAWIARSKVGSNCFSSFQRLIS